MRYVFAFMLAAALAPATASVLAAEPHWDQVGQALGKPGAVQPGGVYRVALPRSDLKVTLDGLALQPGFALGGWVAFEPMGEQSMVMGDLVLTQDEVTPVMRKLVADGFEITALHNHLLRAEPATLFMHVSATGDADKLAGELHDALALSKTPLSAGPAPASQPSLDLDTAALDKAMGYQGKASGAVYQYSISRAKPVTQDGMAIPAAMGSAIGINFQPTGSGKAAITGDFILAASEVNPVIKALADNGIEVAALHSHMLNEEPHMFFMHFWANDDAVKLGKGLRAALDQIDVKKP